MVSMQPLWTVNWTHGGCRLQLPAGPRCTHWPDHPFLRGNKGNYNSERASVCCASSRWSGRTDIAACQPQLHKSWQVSENVYQSVKYQLVSSDTVASFWILAEKRRQKCTAVELFPDESSYHMCT